LSRENKKHLPVKKEKEKQKKQAAPEKLPAKKDVFSSLLIRRIIILIFQLFIDNN
jgi:hypothetical protein